MINLTTIRETLKVRVPDIPISNNEAFWGYFNTIIREINRDVRAKFPELSFDFDIDDGYNPFPDGWENLFIDGIIWLYSKDDEAEQNLVNQNYGIFFQSLQTFKSQYVVPMEYRKQPTDYEQKSWDWVPNKGQTSFSPQNLIPIVFFRNDYLVNLYDTEQIDKTKLVILSVNSEISDWIRIERFETSENPFFPPKKVPPKFSLNLPLTYNNQPFQVNYECDLAFKGIIFTEHKNEFENYLFIPNTPQGIKNSIWRTLT